MCIRDRRIARAIRENNARLVIIDPVQAFLGADVDMNRANEVRPIFRSLGDIAQATGCAIVLIGHLNKAAGTQSTYRGLGSIEMCIRDRYAKHDRAEFVRVVQEAQSSQQTTEVRKQRTRLAAAKQRVSDLEVLLCKIYEDNILGKLSDSRYALSLIHI